MDEPEFELLDTGIFAESRYFDVFVEYAKARPEDILVEINAVNRGPDTALARSAADGLVPQHVVLEARPAAARRGPGRAARRPARDPARRGVSRPAVSPRPAGRRAALHRERDQLRARLRRPPIPAPTSRTRFTSTSSAAGATRSIPTRLGTKAAARYHFEIPPGGTARVRLRLTDAEWNEGDPLGEDFDRALALRRSEADEFYAAVLPDALSREEKSVMRQAFAGMLWSKQFYKYDVRRWLEGDPLAASPARIAARPAATATGGTSSTPTSSRCPTPGSSPGTRRGTWRSTASSSRSSTRSSPRTSSSSCCASGTCTRTGRFRRTSGTSAT